MKFNKYKEYKKKLKGMHHWHDALRCAKRNHVLRTNYNRKCRTRILWNGFRGEMCGCDKDDDEAEFKDCPAWYTMLAEEQIAIYMGFSAYP